MKKLLIAGLLCLATPATAASVWNAPADVAAIAALEQQKLDVPDVAASFAPDALVVDVKAGEVYEGRPAIQRAATALRAPFKSAKSSIREQSILTNGNMACVLQTVDYQFLTKDSQPVSLSLRQMNVLKKRGGRWQVIHEHLSTPMDPANGLAVTSDLQVRGNWTGPPNVAASQRVSVAQAQKELATWAHDSFRALPVDNLMTYYGPGENDVMAYAPTTPGNLRGLAELRTYLAASLATVASLEITVPVLRIDTDGELGAQIDVQFIESHLKDGKTEITYWRQSDCLRRVDGKWHAMMAMVSFPVNPVTAKSIVLVPKVPENLTTEK